MVVCHLLVREFSAFCSCSIKFLFVGVSCCVSKVICHRILPIHPGSFAPTWKVDAINVIYPLNFLRSHRDLRDGKRTLPPNLKGM